MSYMFTSSSFPKVRQEGFHTQTSIQNPSGAQGQQSQRQQHLPTPNAFDPNAIYTTGALFADAYRATPADPFARRYEQQQQQQQQQAPSSHSLDIHDELSFLNPPTSATSETFQQQQQPPRTHDLFGVNQSHYPSLSLPHSRALYSRDDFSSTTPASLHNSYGRSDFFPSQSNPANAQSNDGRHPPELTPQQQQQQQQFGLMATAAANTLVDQFNPGGEQSPASGVTRSRSRSRSKVSASRNRVSKRPSLPPPPADEPSPDSSRAPSATRPSAIVIPGSTHGQQSSHSFSSYHAGTHPTSPATWGFATHTGDQYGAEASPAHQLFGTSFGGPGSLGPGQSPTTLNGSPPPANASEAAIKLALANEKRRKRRESHNAVERRRRDNINEKIQELALLLPEEWVEGTGKGQGPSIAGLLSGTVSGSALGSAASLEDEVKEIKANKGVILRNSVEYIKNLVQLVQVQRTRNQQLESELAQYRNRYGSVTSTGAEAGSLTLNGSGVSPGMQSGGHTDDETNAMAGYVLSDALSSPEAFDMKNLFSQASLGPLDVINNSGSQAAHGHGHTMSSSGMEGIETSGAMGGTNLNSGITHAAGNGGLTSGVSAMLLDATSPSTNSGENEDVDDEEMHRGRRATRFPPGVGKQEDEIPAL